MHHFYAVTFNSYGTRVCMTNWRVYCRAHNTAVYWNLWFYIFLNYVISFNVYTTVVWQRMAIDGFYSIIMVIILKLYHVYIHESTSKNLKGRLHHQHEGSCEPFYLLCCCTSIHIHSRAAFINYLWTAMIDGSIHGSVNILWLTFVFV